MDPTLTAKQIQNRLGAVDPMQLQAWRQMTNAQRLEIAFQAYQFALNAVRITERTRAPDISEEEFNWRITRRMQGNQKLGREFYDIEWQCGLIGDEFAPPLSSRREETVDGRSDLVAFQLDSRVS